MAAFSNQPLDYWSPNRSVIIDQIIQALGEAKPKRIGIDPRIGILEKWDTKEKEVK